MKKLLELALKAAFEASKKVLSVYEDKSEDWEIETKSDDSPLTKADKLAHQAICKVLEESGFPILSEEGREIPYEERKNWGRFWLVDPLDGTKEFIKRNGEFTVNIALIEKQKPVLGVVWVPVLDKVYFSSTETGAYCLENAEIEFQKISDLNDLMMLSEKIEARKAEPGKTVRVVASRSHLNEETKNFIEDLKNNYSEVKVVSAGSSLKLCLVAEGKAHIYPRFGPTMEWDTAAGQAVVEGAGAVVLEAGKEEALLYNKEDLLNPYFLVKC